MLSSTDEHLRAPLNPKSPPMAGTSTVDKSGFTSLTSLPGGDRSFVGRVKGLDAPSLIRYLRYVNVILAVMQALAGFMGLFNLVTLDITSFLISVYAIVFALLLLAFECRFTSMEPSIRQQFGFLFTYRGRTAFLFIVGFMDFGMDSSFGYLVGVLMSANAIFNLLILFCHPEFRNGHLTSTMDPTATYTEGSEETAQLLSQNTDFMNQAGSFVMHQAKENPQYAAQLAQSYAKNGGGYVPPAQTR